MLGLMKAWSAARAIWYGLQLDDDDNLLVNTAPLSDDVDEIDVSRKTKGLVTTTHAGLTAASLSGPVDCTGFNAILVDMDITEWTSGTPGVALKGAIDGAGDYATIYGSSGAGQALASFTMPGSVTRQIHVFFGIPDSVKISVTGAMDATYTCRVQPFNI